jgi:4-hydroxybenzoate polyprenyltransferase
MSQPPHSRDGDSVLLLAVLYLVHSNLLISLSATGVAVSTMVLVGLAIDPVALFIVFAVTLFVYSFNRITDLAEDRQNVPSRTAFVSRYGRRLLAVGVVLYLVAIGAALALSLPGVPALAAPLAVAVLYSTVGLKRVLLVKNLMVGVSWGAIPIGVGVYYGELGSTEVLVLAGFFTTMLTIAAAVFDIKDIEGDREAGITTVPIVVGPAWTRRLAAGATAVVAACVATLLLTGVLPARYGVLLGFTAYVCGYSLVATRDRGPLFYGFVIDGEHLFLALALLGYQAAVAVLG